MWKCCREETLTPRLWEGQRGLVSGALTIANYRFAHFGIKIGWKPVDRKLMQLPATTTPPWLGLRNTVWLRRSRTQIKLGFPASLTLF